MQGVQHSIQIPYQNVKNPEIDFKSPVINEVKSERIEEVPMIREYVAEENYF